MALASFLSLTESPKHQRTKKQKMRDQHSGMVARLRVEYLLEYSRGALFGTITFAKGIKDYEIAAARWESICQGIVRDRYDDYVAIFEHHESGAIHIHLVVGMRKDRLSAIAESRYWARLAPKYGLGRMDFQLPRNRQRIAVYLTKTIRDGSARRIGKRTFRSSARVRRAVSDQCQRLTCGFRPKIKKIMGNLSEDDADRLLGKNWQKRHFFHLVERGMTLSRLLAIAGT